MSGSRQENRNALKRLVTILDTDDSFASIWFLMSATLFVHGSIALCDKVLQDIIKIFANIEERDEISECYELVLHANVCDKQDLWCMWMDDQAVASVFSYSLAKFFLSLESYTHFPSCWLKTKKQRTFSSRIHRVWINLKCLQGKRCGWHLHNTHCGIKQKAPFALPSEVTITNTSLKSTQDNNDVEDAEIQPLTNSLWRYCTVGNGSDLKFGEYSFLTDYLIDVSKRNRTCFWNCETTFQIQLIFTSFFRDQVLQFSQCWFTWRPFLRKKRVPLVWSLVPGEEKCYLKTNETSSSAPWALSEKRQSCVVPICKRFAQLTSIGGSKFVNGCWSWSWVHSTL